MVKKIAIIQARLSSTRLPGKVLKDLAGKTLLHRVINRVKLAKSIDEVWVATSNDISDDIVEIAAKTIGVKVHRGDLDNVLERFWDVSEKSCADIIVRITADNPLTEFRFIDEGIDHLIESGCEYVYYENIPHGTGVEIFSKNALRKTYQTTFEKNHLEHVTLYMRENKDIFRIKILHPSVALRRPDINLTIDTLDEYTNLYKLHYQLNDVIEKKNEFILEKAIEILDSKD